MKRRFGILTLSLTLVAVFQGMSADTLALVSPHRTSDAMHAEWRDFGVHLPFENNKVVDPIIVSAADESDTTMARREHAHTLLEKVLAAQNFVELLDAYSVVELPVGVVRSGTSFDYTILVDRIEFTTAGAVMDVYASLVLPQTGTRLAFHGRVPLSAQGGIAGTAKLFLLGDHSADIDGTTLVTIRGNDKTYVEFDCSGFLGINIVADMEISRDLLLPENERGEVTEGRVQMSFTTYTQSLNDILLHVTLPPFQLAGLKGFGFHVQSAWLDWSDESNAPQFSFPVGYESSLIGSGLPNLWRGLYLHQVELLLPPAFARRQSGNRVALGMQAALFDEQGFSGRVYARNILPDGDMSGWDYTIDELHIDILTQRISGMGFKGSISVPVLSNDEGEPAKFAYEAYRNAAGDYQFVVETGGDLRLDLWAARLRLFDGSTIGVVEKDQRFYPEARLSGELSISVPGSGPKLRFNSLRFENMIISSEAPYFVPGTFGFGKEGDQSKLSEFPVVFSNIRIRTDQTRVGLAFDMLVNISGKPEDESFAGKGGLTIWGQQSGEPLRDAHGEVIGINRQTWEFDQVEISTIRINVSKPKVFEFKGELRFFSDDKVYGEGFRGTVRGKLQSIQVEAQALFGATETFRYWYADALVELTNGVPMLPGVLSAFGFGGGYFSKMRQTTEPVHTALAKSPSGITYIPDESTVGIRAMVLIGTPRPEAMRGDVALEVIINRYGGINSVTFTGNAKFMSAAALGTEKVKELAAAAVDGKLSERLQSLAQGQVHGKVRLHFDNVNDIFHGNLEIFVNVAGGIVRGVSPGNKAGWAELYFARNDWHILIGTPDQPLGLEVARLFKAKSYFMLGKALPGSPPPPPQVSEILGNVDLDYMRDMNALESGTGIAFGLHFLVDTGDLQFLMFYGRFSAGTGIDFMLKDYGDAYHCAGMSGPMGIDGWYANGQAYAFVTGKIGIKVNLRFYKGTYDILNIGAAAILQAKGPNPFWMKGTVGGYYSILGGLVKGRCRFEVTVGKECKPVTDQNLLKDVNMIAGISPANAAVDVDVFAAPQVVFNIPVNETFEIIDIESKKHIFRAVLDEFTVESRAGRLTGTLVWNDERDVVIFDTDDMLPGDTEITARAALAFEENINGVWERVRYKGKPVQENATVKFTTATAPDYIPNDNILYAYPLPGHVNFHPNEHGEGFIKLKRGQPYLFERHEERRPFFVMIDEVTGESHQTPIRYQANERVVSFAIPDGLRLSRRYSFSLISLPETTHSVDENVLRIDREIPIDKAAGIATQTDKTIESALVRREATSMYTSYLHTSRYPTFGDKMRHITLGTTARLTTGPNIFRLSATLHGEESFHYQELAIGTGLIRMKAILTNNYWYEHYAYPLLYQDYPLDGWLRLRRESTSLSGVPPVRDIHVRFYEPPTPGIDRPFIGESLTYDVGQSVAADFFDLRHQAVNFIADSPDRITPRLSALTLEPLPHLRYGVYHILLSYVLPGTEQVTSSYVVEMFNPIPDNE